MIISVTVGVRWPKSICNSKNTLKKTEENVQNCDFWIELKPKCAFSYEIELHVSFEKS